jgi:fibronectin-binding autotransporter adhesin
MTISRTNDSNHFHQRSLTSLRANNTYTGNTTISNGTLVVGDGRANGSISGSANIINNANLSFNRSDSVILAKAISGSGNVSQNGTGTLTLTEANIYTGSTIVNNGSLVIGDGNTSGSINSNVSVNNNTNFSFNRSNAISFNKIISGDGNFTKSGVGNLTLTATNTYTGLTTISNGSLVIGDGGTNGSISNTSGIVTDGTLIFNRSDNITVAQNITGIGNLTQNGTGIVSLTANNTYGGTTRIERGTLSLGAGGTAGSIENINSVVNDGTLMFNRSNDITSF